MRLCSILKHTFAAWQTLPWGCYFLKTHDKFTYNGLKILISICIALRVHFGFLVCLVSVSVYEKEKHKEDFISTLWPGHTVQRESAARNYSTQHDRPSHLLRIMKGRGCHSAPTRSHTARSSLLLALQSAAHMMHSVWLFYKSNSSSEKKNRGNKSQWVELSWVLHQRL